MGFFGLFSSGKKDKSSNPGSNNQVQKDTLSFDEQMKVFNSLGYHLNEGVTKETIFQGMKGQAFVDQDFEKNFTDDPFQRLYYYLGWRNDTAWYTNNCVWYDIEFIDPSSQYISFMKRMGQITDGEINYTDILLCVDEEKYEWLEFNVNGIPKRWKLGKVQTIDDSFFNRFSYITKELNTKGRYTYYDDGGQQFVIDYATPEEQEKFIQATGLKREWLGEVAHFNEPKD